MLRARYDVHVLDFEGHGAAATRQRPFRIEHFAENVRDYTQERGLTGVRVFGYSMGGYVALTLAAHDESLVSCVVTLATRFHWTPDGAAKEGAMLVPDLMQEKVPRFARTLHDRHGERWQQVVTATAEMIQHLGRQPVVDAALLERVAQRVRLVVGDRDTTVTVEETAIASRVPARGELEVLPATAHPFEKVSMERLVRTVCEVFDAGGSSDRP